MAKIEVKYFAILNFHFLDICDYRPHDDLGALTEWQTLSWQNSPSSQVTPLQSTLRKPSGNAGANTLRM